MKISYKQVEESCNEMHQIANNIKDILNNISNTSKTLIKHNVWQGDAASYYVSKFQKFEKNFDEIYKELEYSVLYMAKCSDNYKTIDKKIVQEICNNLNISEPNLLSSKIFS